MIFGKLRRVQSGDGEHGTWQSQKVGELLQDGLEVSGRFPLGLCLLFYPQGATRPVPGLGPRALPCLAREDTSILSYAHIPPDAEEPSAPQSRHPCIVLHEG